MFLNKAIKNNDIDALIVKSIRYYESLNLEVDMITLMEPIFILLLNEYSENVRKILFRLSDMSSSTRCNIQDLSSSLRDISPKEVSVNCAKLYKNGVLKREKIINCCFGTKYNYAIKNPILKKWLRENSNKTVDVWNK